MAAKKTNSTTKASAVKKESTAKNVKTEPAKATEKAVKAEPAKAAEKAVKAEPAKAIETKKDTTKKLETKAAVLVDTPEKTETKAPAKKAPAKKAAAKKAPAKKKAEVKTEMFLQFAGKEYTEKEIFQKVKEIWIKVLKNKVGDMKDVKIYLKPEESAAYYVVNRDTTGKVDL